MKPSRRPRSLFSAAAVALASMAVFTACGVSAPPADELAVEVIDSMVLNDTITEDEAECMRAEVEELGNEALEEMASLANDNDSRGLEAMDEFEAALASCR